MRLRSAHGFTLVELLVTMTLASVVFGGTLSVVEIFQRQSSYAQRRNENQDNARTALDRLSRMLRNVVAPTATYVGALEQAGSYSIVFRTVDTSSESTTHAMIVRYCLDDTTPSDEILWEEVKKLKNSEESSGSTATCEKSTSGWTSKQQLVQYVSNELNGKNRPLFEYGPKPTEEVTKITAVSMNLYIKSNTGSLPGEAELTTGVSLRNANRKPEAKFTVTNIGRDEMVLNASESYDPDGLTLTYKWWMNGAEQSSTAQIWQTQKLESKQSYTFKLEVANPGGLSSTEERTVTAP
jgi:prepilin-type N-terminal cleavage/methylation domain-containing protein